MKTCHPTKNTNHKKIKLFEIAFHFLNRIIGKFLNSKKPAYPQEFTPRKAKFFEPVYTFLPNSAKMN
jgi:hypothetical protein